MRIITTVALAALFGLGACGEVEVEEVPEAAEIEGFDTDEVPGEALELDAETEIDTDDIGEEIAATGQIEGLQLPNGFFLRTDANRVIFVATDASVEPGETVRVLGTVAGTEVAVFEGWESDAFDVGFEAEWDVETIAYIDAYSVLPVDGAMEGGQGQDGQVDGATTPESPSPGQDEVEDSDPGSKSG